MAAITFQFVWVGGTRADERGERPIDELERANTIASFPSDNGRLKRAATCPSVGPTFWSCAIEKSRSRRVDGAPDCGQHPA